MKELSVCECDGHYAMLQTHRTVHQKGGILAYVNLKIILKNNGRSQKKNKGVDSKNVEKISSM